MFKQHSHFLLPASAPSPGWNSCSALYPGGRGLWLTWLPPQQRSFLILVDTPRWTKWSCSSMRGDGPLAALSCGRRDGAKAGGNILRAGADPVGWKAKRSLRLLNWKIEIAWKVLLKLWMVKGSIEFLVTFGIKSLKRTPHFPKFLLLTMTLVFSNLFILFFSILWKPWRNKIRHSQVQTKLSVPQMLLDSRK